MSCSFNNNNHPHSRRRLLKSSKNTKLGYRLKISTLTKVEICLITNYCTDINCKTSFRKYYFMYIKMHDNDLMQIKTRTESNVIELN